MEKGLKITQRMDLNFFNCFRGNFFKVRTLLRALGWGPISLNVRVRPKSDRGDAA